MPNLGQVKLGKDQLCPAGLGKGLGQGPEGFRAQRMGWKEKNVPST